MDDEYVIRETTAEMLKIFGYSVMTTKNGNEALELFKGGIESGFSF